MRYILYIASLLTIGVVVFVSCKKYKDPAPYTDPRLTTHYCNDPNAANYNVGFPGTPDNTVCIYPRDLFVGKWVYRDSVYQTESGRFLFSDSFMLTISPVGSSLTKIIVKGFCPSGANIYMTSSPIYEASIDSLIGDTTTIYRGQTLCRIKDTISGSMTKDRVDSTILHVAFQVVSDTGITTHTGFAKKQ